MDFGAVCVSCWCAGSRVFATNQVWYYWSIYDCVLLIFPVVVNSGLGLAGVGCVWKDLDCRGAVLLVVYMVPMHMVVAHKMVDILVVNIVVCSNGMAAELLESAVGIPG